MMNAFERVTRREMVYMTAKTMVAGLTIGSTPVSALAAGDGQGPLQFVHPELRPAWRAVKQWSSQAEKPAAPAGLGQLVLASDWIERRIPGRAGAPQVRVYVHGAKAGTSRPAILHIHGGGYTGGSPAIAMGTLRPIAEAIDCVIVTVDYRLAPGTPFPGALDDNYAALLWLHSHASELGVDRSRIAVMGESAGGGHAAMLAIAARDRGEVAIAFQALVYPMLDDRTGANGAPRPPYIDAVTWTPENNRQGWTALLGVPAGSPNVPAGSVPARAENLAMLPPAYIAVGSIDIFVDEDIAYARRLIDLGIPVELNVVPGAFHGFDIFAHDTALARKFIDRLVAALSAALAG